LAAYKNIPSGLENDKNQERRRKEKGNHAAWIFGIFESKAHFRKADGQHQLYGMVSG
jgi:hypothetical protein